MLTGSTASSFEAVRQIRQRMDQPRVSFADEARRHTGANKPTTTGPLQQVALPEEQLPTPNKPAHEEPIEAKAAARGCES